MKSYLTAIIILFVFSSCCTFTRYYVVRHAERTSTDCNSPLLSPQGTNRANTLRDSLLSKGIDSIFVSVCLRTQQTAQPLATALGITMIQSGTSAAETTTLVNRLLKIRKKDVLVVGHTSTVPAIVLGLSGQTIAPIPETDFDNMYIIRIKRCHRIYKSLTHITYGVPTN